jgi:hypothetical protein
MDDSYYYKVSKPGFYVILLTESALVFPGT